MNGLIIGIDGGGTKTLGVLFDPKGNEIARHTSGSGNISVDDENTIRHLETILDDLTNKAGDEKITSIQIGLAGYANYPGKPDLKQRLLSRYGIKANVTTDAVLALYSVKKDSRKNTMMILAGTGSIVVTESSGIIRYFGGFGHLLGDEGSAYHTAVEALKRIIETCEKNKALTSFQQDVLREIDADDYTGIKHFVYNQPKRKIAELARFIAKRANEGGQEASELIRNAGEHLAKLTIRAYRSLPQGEEVLIGFRGGFLRNVPLLRQSLMHYLNETDIDYKLEKEPGEPVTGSYYLAKKQMETRKKDG